MPNIIDTTEMVKKVLPIIYVLDTSGSMSGEKIAAVNEAMHETVDVLKDISEKNPDAQVKIAALAFSTGSRWITSENTLEDLEDFVWTDLVAGGTTDLGNAISELDKKLSRSELLKSEVGFCIPVILFLTDGHPTDSYINILKNANKNNNWFRHATKIGIAVGEDADQEALARVVGNSEAVISVHDNDTLKALIKVASITSSMVNSKSRTSSDTNNAVEIINQTMQMLPCKGVTLNKSSSSETKKTDNNSSDYTIIDLDESNW